MAILIWCIMAGTLSGFISGTGEDILTSWSNLMILLDYQFVLFKDRYILHL